jgi:hypothetical protein
MLGYQLRKINKQNTMIIFPTNEKTGVFKMIITSLSSHAFTRTPTLHSRMTGKGSGLKRTMWKLWCLWSQSIIVERAWKSSSHHCGTGSTAEQFNNLFSRQFCKCFTQHVDIFKPLSRNRKLNWGPCVATKLMKLLHQQTLSQLTKTDLQQPSL